MKTFDAAGIARPWLWPAELIGEGGGPSGDYYTEAEVDALLAGYAPLDHSQHVPGIPGTITPSTVGTALQIDWSAPVDGGEADTYKVIATPAGANPTLSDLAVVGTTKSFSGAAADTYDISVVGTNEMGDGAERTYDAFVHAPAHPLTAYSNLIALWDAHSVSQGDNTDLTQWDMVADVAGGWVLKVAGAGNPPKYRTASLNSHPCVQFDGVNDRLEDNVNGVLTPQTDGSMTVFIVVEPEATAASQVNGMLNNLGSGYNDGDWWWGIKSDGAAMFDFRTSAASTTVRYSETRTAYGSAGVHAIRVNGDTITGAWADGTKYTSGVGAGNYGASSDQNYFRVGGNLQTGSTFFKGKIGAIAVFSDAKSDGDVGSIITDLKGLFGL